jgi:hypothetical protein
MAHTRNGLEHRWGERVRVNIPVRVSTAALASVGGRLQNLSLSGALMKCECDLRLHALIEVLIELPPPAGHAALLEAYVSRIVDEGMGIEWCAFAPHIVKGLLRDPSVRFTHGRAGSGQAGDETTAMSAGSAAGGSRT